MEIKVTELVITLFYFAFCVLIGVYFTRKASSGESQYWGAGQNISATVNGFALFATNVSAASFLGFLGLAYKMGWSFAAMGVGVSLTFGYIWSMLVVSGPLRRYSQMRGRFTLSSFFSERFGNSTGLASSIIILLLYPVYIVPQLIGGGLAAVYVLGISFKSAVILIGCVYVLYVVMAGMLSVTYTDFMQGILMITFMVGLAILAFIHYGGYSEMMPKVLEVKPDFLGISAKLSMWTYLGMFFGVAFFAFSSPHIIMRHFTAKGVNSGRRAVIFTALLCWVFHVIGYLGVAGACWLIDPKLTNVDRTYLIVMDALFPPVVRGLAVAGILAAIMSTTGGMLLACGVEFSDNIVKKFFKPNMTEKQVIVLSRCVIAFLGIVTMAMALNETKSIGYIVAMLVQGTASAFAAPIFFGIWWKRATNLGGFLSCAGGFVAFVIITTFKLVPFLGEILISLPISVILMVIGSLLTPAPKKETVAFVEQLHQAVYSK